LSEKEEKLNPSIKEVNHHRIIQKEIDLAVTSYIGSD
jgi:hypothetical protein